MTGAAHRKLTDRQAAVLAAVERHGRPVMADLSSEFPDLVPSTLKQVLDALENKGLVARAGDDHHVYLGGVHWWSTALTPTEFSAVLAVIIRVIDAGPLGLSHSADPHDNCVTVFLPLAELESHLAGLPSPQMELLRACIKEIEDGGYSVRVAVSTRITMDAEPLLAIELRPSIGHVGHGPPVGRHVHVMSIAEQDAAIQELVDSTGWQPGDGTASISLLSTVKGNPALDALLSELGRDQFLGELEGALNDFEDECEDLVRAWYRDDEEIQVGEGVEWWVLVRLSRDEGGVTALAEGFVMLHYPDVDEDIDESAGVTGSNVYVRVQLRDVEGVWRFASGEVLPDDSMPELSA